MTNQISSKEEESNQITTKEGYLKLFENIPECNRLEVIKIILDTRKFEIDLYWKRSTYFFALIGALYAGFFTLFASFKENELETQNKLKILFLLNSLGVVFSIGWYFVNRGSKFWQLNWEKHIAMMEDSIIGPLFKTRISMSYYSSIQKLINPTAPFTFSVTRINQVLSLTVLLSWLATFFYMADKYLEFSWSLNFYTWLIIITIVEIFALVFMCYSEKDYAWSKWKDHTFVNFDNTYIKVNENANKKEKANKKA